MDLLLPSDVLIMSSDFGWVITWTQFMQTSAWGSLATLTFLSVSKAASDSFHYWEISGSWFSSIFARTPQLTKKLKVCLECGVWQRAVVVGFRSTCSCVFIQREREGLGVASSVFSLDFFVERRFLTLVSPHELLSPATIELVRNWGTERLLGPRSHRQNLELWTGSSQSVASEP